MGHFVCYVPDMFYLVTPYAYQTGLLHLISDQDSMNGFHFIPCLNWYNPWLGATPGAIDKDYLQPLSGVVTWSCQDNMLLDICAAQAEHISLVPMCCFAPCITSRHII